MHTPECRRGVPTLFLPTLGPYGTNLVWGSNDIGFLGAALRPS